MHLYTGWVGTLLASLALPFVWTTLPALVAVGRRCASWALMATVGHFMLILAYQRAPAATLTPYLYAQIAFAMLGGWLVFSHVPDGWSMVGIVDDRRLRRGRRLAHGAREPAGAGTAGSLNEPESMAQYFEVHPDNPQPRLLKQAVALLERGGVRRRAHRFQLCAGLPPGRQGRRRPAAPDPRRGRQAPPHPAVPRPERTGHLRPGGQPAVPAAEDRPRPAPTPSSWRPRAKCRAA